MGNTQWRSFEEGGGFTKKYQDKLIADVKSEAEAKINDTVSAKRILLWGPIKAGKSSLMDSFASIDTGRIANKAVAMGGQLVGGHSVTRKLHKVILKNGMKNVELLDTMGLEPGTEEGFDPEVTPHLLAGKLKRGYEFAATGSETEDIQNFEPIVNMKAHCHVLVISAKDVDTNSLPKPMLDKITTFCLHSNKSGVPPILLLTKIELVCEEVDKDVKKVYTSKNVYDVVQKATELFGVKEMDIFPVRNYTNESELKIPLNILLLLALRQMVRYARDYIENAQEPSDTYNNVHTQTQ